MDSGDGGHTTHFDGDIIDVGRDIGEDVVDVSNP